MSIVIHVSYINRNNPQQWFNKQNDNTSSCPIGQLLLFEMTHSCQQSIILRVKGTMNNSCAVHNVNNNTFKHIQLNIYCERLNNSMYQGWRWGNFIINIGWGEGVDVCYCIRGGGDIGYFPQLFNQSFNLLIFKMDSVII